MTIISNKIQCNTCKDIIESTHRHDFVRCSCESIAVDGGKSYLRRVGNLQNYTDLSEVINEEEV
jgi:hypothetical protein